jgi:hypothetical protein
MPHATNPLDGIRTYFEDSGGNAPAVLFYTGFADPLEVAKASRLARELSAEFRLIFADHRGQAAATSHAMWAPTPCRRAPRTLLQFSTH